MITIFAIWLAGGLASLGLLKGILTVEGGDVESETILIKFLQSWYSFGVLLGIILGEIGKSLEKTGES